VTALVVALAGTDHHPFDRMVTWVDEAATRHRKVRFVVQHGTATRPPVVAEGHEFLTHDRLAALLAEATVVVCHGGPGTIMDAREAGHVPLCMPRDPRLGEHVDGHQQRFAALVGDAGVVRAVSTPEAFHRELDRALLGAPPASVVTMATRARDTARAQLAAELDGLIVQRPHRFGRRNRTSM
jgi:UDP-N-acetylglucosamine transferase subunit ALG13